ncbi:bifunctional phosphoribosyl-AMP cyclohydrolase/phosphoribosyl-ATP diphosphatase HisIE [Polycladomyces subterraneus]|uniref:Histidine biosynthesis bifunctional protein HisIE n=1 Tax=Polycladomyces subterraneus TaxID=1016997 RepID=A0ABT8INH3_9BACL|nr:bifunctional phosphoribosyl-AMP cyclohydrolase/phosphoribosyl-ATP diphosphatase HisIE [Polycladomyces subterraneus]MDN4594350.1 bifunctional phosphoribosyl-AMP cyclohydrolase/phosphoribosyl-ATP diphosphatase HisIE [Polycladomyces subterraneus]
MDGQIDVSAIRWDDRGLVPAIVQDAVSKEVLTLAYMNETALKKTIETGETWFWSRSRQSLWHKGETSGHRQRVVSLQWDCDRDSLLVKVIPNGPACHTGAVSCFGTVNPSGEEPTTDRFDILNRLESLIARREAERPEGSYTTYLFEKGLDKILKKVGEEAAEVIIAAKNESHEELRYEMADLLYHLLVLLRQAKLPLDDVLAELRGRYADQKE